MKAIERKNAHGGMAYHERKWQRNGENSGGEIDQSMWYCHSYHEETAISEMASAISNSAASKENNGISMAYLAKKVA